MPLPDDYRPEDDGWMKVKSIGHFCEDCSYASDPEGGWWVLPCDWHEKAIAELSGS
jgi:hypothetical protein